MKQKYLENKYNKICQMIEILENNYFNGVDTKKELEDAYNKMLMYKYKLEILTQKSYYRSLKKVNDKIIFIDEINIKEHNVDNDLLEHLYNKEFYTKTEADNLIRWTVNNTRQNLKILCNADSLNNYDLNGTCGFSQFSSLYPLEKLGLKVTYNNIANLFNQKAGMHAFGIVEIPIIDNGVKIAKKYIIDCTYCQFFVLKDCVEAKYLNSHVNNGICAPMAGYFMTNNEELKNFSKNMLEDGFCEMTDDNLMKYCYGLYMQEFNIIEVQNAIANFKTLDIRDKLESNSMNKDYNETELLELGCNLEIKPLKNYER